MSNTIADTNTSKTANTNNRHKLLRLRYVIVRSVITAQRTALTVTQPHFLAMTLLTQRLQKLVSPSQGFRPEDLRGHQHTVDNSRHTNANTNLSHDYEHDREETEIIHIGRKSQNECAVMATIGNRSYKALWDSGAAKYVLSLDCYQSISQIQNRTV